MSANGLWKSRYENESGYGDTISAWGVINVVGSEVYINSVPLRALFRQYEGEVVAMELVFGLKRFERCGGIDVNVLPLVEAMRALGVITLDSCEGHMKPHDGGENLRFVRVDFTPDGLSKMMQFADNDWLIQKDTPCEGTIRLRSKVDAKNEEEIKRYQEKALELAERINKTIIH